jgi:hypothetical protein
MVSAALASSNASSAARGRLLVERDAAAQDECVGVKQAHAEQESATS